MKNVPSWEASDARLDYRIGGLLQLTRGPSLGMNRPHASGGLPYKSIRGLRVLRVDRKDTVNKEGGLTNRKDDCRPLWSS